MDEIKELLIEYGENDGWYNAQKILPYYDETMVFWIAGARRIGKTDFFLKLACDLYLRFKKCTMWVRNKDVELSDPRFFNSFLNDAKDLGWCPKAWVIRSDGVYESKERDAKKIIEFQAVSTFGNMRGGAHPDTILMVFDEFMPEDRKYPKMCATALMSATKTVFSGRTNCRVFCLSNFVSGANPYFAHFEIYPDPEKDVTICPGRMLIERCRGYHTAIDPDNPWTDVYIQGKYGDYCDSSEDPLMELVKKVPNGAKPAPWVLKKNGVHYRAFLRSGIMYWRRYDEKLHPETLIYTGNLQECSDKVLLIPSWLVKQLKQFSDAGALKFSNPNVLYVVLNLIYDSV